MIRNFLYDIKNSYAFFEIGYIIVNCFSIHNLVLSFLIISVLYSLSYNIFKHCRLRTCISSTKQNRYYSLVLQNPEQSLIIKKMNLNNIYFGKNWTEQMLSSYWFSPTAARNKKKILDPPVKWLIFDFTSIANEMLS